MGYKKIVCGVTCSEASARAAARAAQIAKDDDAELIYVNVADSTFLKGNTISSRPHHAEDALLRFGDHCLQYAREIARALGVTSRTTTRKGRVYGVIRELILEEHADLLVIGHESRTFFEKFILNGQVEKHIDKLKEETGIDVVVVE